MQPTDAVKQSNKTLVILTNKKLNKKFDYKHVETKIVLVTYRVHWLINNIFFMKPSA